MPSNFTGDPTAAQAPDGAPALNTYPVVALPVGTDALTAASTYQPWKDCACRIAYIQDKLQMYGTGADGSVTFDGATTILGMVPVANVYTMTRDISCINVTVNNGVTINTGCYRIRCTGAFTASGTAAINAQAVINGSFGAGGAGAAAGTAGSALFGLGGAGGAGGSGGGAGGTIAGPYWDWKAHPYLMQGCTIGYTSGAAFITGVRGGGGGGGGANSGGTGGTGGNGGGVVFIAARTVNATFTSNVSGGNGAAGVGGTAGGGGGGGGGAVVVVYGTKTSLAVTITATGGNGGANAGGGGATNGTAGNTTVIEVVQS